MSLCQIIKKEREKWKTNARISKVAVSKAAVNRAAVSRVVNRTRPTSQARAASKAAVRVDNDKAVSRTAKIWN